MCIFSPLVGYEPRCGNLDCYCIEGYYILCILCVCMRAHACAKHPEQYQFMHIDVYNLLYADDFPLEIDASPCCIVICYTNRSRLCHSSDL
jgi:hypothetical protein